MCKESAVDSKEKTGAPVNEIEVTPEMVLAGGEEMSRRWLEFVSDSDSLSLWDEVLLAVFLAMLEARFQ
jgi:hypothetical protein